MGLVMGCRLIWRLILESERRCYEEKKAVDMTFALVEAFSEGNEGSRCGAGAVLRTIVCELGAKSSAFVVADMRSLIPFYHAR